VNSFVAAEKVTRIAEVLHERFNNLTLKETNDLALKILKAVNEVDLKVDDDNDIPF
jgi:hypothetical protein